MNKLHQLFDSFVTQFLAVTGGIAFWIGVLGITGKVLAIILMFLTIESFIYKIRLRKKHKRGK